MTGSAGQITGGGMGDGEEIYDGELNVKFRDGNTWYDIGRLYMQFDTADTSQPLTVHMFWHITDPTRFATVTVGTILKWEVLQWPAQKSGTAFTTPSVSSSQKKASFDASVWDTGLDDEADVSALVQTEGGLPKKSRWNVCDTEPSNGNPMDGDDGGPLGLMYRQSENDMYTGEVLDQWILNDAFWSHMEQGAVFYLRSVTNSANLDWITTGGAPWRYWRERYTPVSGP